MTGVAVHNRSIDPALFGALEQYLPALKARYGLSGLTVVFQDGKYYLNADGNLIEIAFVNGDVIILDAINDLETSLRELLEANGVPLLDRTFGENAEGSLGVMEAAALGLLSLAISGNGGQLNAGKSARGLPSEGTPIVEGITSDPVRNTVVLDYNKLLDPSHRPTAEDFRVRVGGEQVEIAGIQVEEDKVILELARDIQTGDSIVVEYADQGDDYDNAIQSADGDRAFGFISGVVIDGYISGAQIYVDTNQNGIPDPDELLEGLVTDAQGRFVLDASLNPENAPLLFVGGTNTDTGLTNNTILTAAIGASTYTPLTTLIQTMVRDGLAEDVEAANSLVVKALGLSPEIDLQNFDPLLALKNPATAADAVAVHKFNTAAIELIEALGAGTSSNATAAKSAIAKALVSGASSETPLELDSAFAATIIDTVFKTGNNAVLKTNVGVVVDAIQAADSLDDIRSAQKGLAVTVTSNDKTNDNTPIIEGKAPTGTTVFVEIAGATYKAVVSNSGHWSVDTGSDSPISGVLDLADNAKTNFSITVKDAAGNESSKFFYELTIDTLAPTARLLSVFDNTGSITGALSSGDTTDDRSVLLSGTNEAGSTVEVFDGTTSLGQATVTGTGWSFAATVINGTTHQFNVKETDAAGNVSAATSNFTVIGDTIAPSVFAIDATLEVDNIVNAAEDDTVSVTGTSTGVEQGQTVSVRLSDGSNHVDVTATVGADGTWTAADADISNLTNGAITVTADVSDAAGNAATQTTKTITLDNVAPAAPALALTEDTNITTDGITSDATVDVTGFETNTTWEYSINGGTGWTAGTGTSFEVPEGTHADGDIKVRQTDVAGNVSIIGTLSGALTVDTTVPAAPTLTVIVDVDNASFDAGFSVDEGSEVDVTVEGTTLDSAGLAVKFDKTTASGLDTYVAKEAAFDGSETITVDATITDVAGNTSSAATQLTLQNIDTTAPTIASDVVVVATTSADGTLKNSDIKQSDKIILTVELGEAANDLRNVPTESDSTIIEIDNTAVTADWSKVGNSLQLTYTVDKGVNGAITVNETALKTLLTDVAMTDAAGNDLTVPSFKVTDPVIEVDADDVFFEGLIIANGGTEVDAQFINGSTTAGDSTSGDDTAKIVLDVTDASAGDTAELYVDGVMVFSDALDTTEISGGTITTGELTFVDDTNQDVALEIKVQNASNTYIQDSGDVTWEYQW